MSDFRHIFDNFLSYRYVPPPERSKANLERVKGVKINCVGNMKMFKTPHFEEVKIQGTNRIFSTYDTSDVADRMGFPIMTRSCPPDPKWANNKDDIFENESTFNKQDATFLQQYYDPGAKPDMSTGSIGWGWCSMQWQNDVGSANVVRKNKKPLLPIHMEALNKYCRYKTLPLIAHLMEE